MAKYTNEGLLDEDIRLIKEKMPVISHNFSVLFSFQQDLKCFGGSEFECLNNSVTTSIDYLNAMTKHHKIYYKGMKDIKSWLVSLYSLGTKKINSNKKLWDLFLAFWRFLDVLIDWSNSAMQYMYVAQEMYGFRFYNIDDCTDDWNECVNKVNAAADEFNKLTDEILEKWENFVHLYNNLEP